METRRRTYDETMFRETFEGEFTYRNGFRRNAFRFAGRPALTCPGRHETLTYAQLQDEVWQLAQALLADEVAPGDVVMFQLSNSLEFALLYLAPKEIGGISCPLNYRLSYGETAVIIAQSRPVVLVYEASLEESVQRAVERAGYHPKRMLRVGGEEEGSLDAYMRGHPSADPGITHPSSAFDETTRLYTVGRRGEPRGVPLNNITEILSAHDVIMQFPLSPLDKTLNMTPWFHRGGLYSGGPNPVFYVGAHSIVMPRFDAALTLDYVGQYGLTYLIGTPTNLQMLHDAQKRQPRDLSSLKGIVTMGAPLEREACRRYQEVLSPNIFNGYGTTEAFWNTFLRPYDLPGKAGSAGRSCTDDDVAVVKLYEDRLAEPDEMVAQDGREVGEVIVRAPGKCTYTYIEQPEAARQTFSQGWVYIGDLGTWDDEGFVTIVTRKDDMLLCGGENIHPRQVEAVLCDHSGVQAAVVVGAPDERWGEVVVAYIVPRDPSLTAAELNRHCLAHPMLARYKRPRYYRFVEGLPGETEKETRRLLTAQAGEDRARGVLQRP